jgi:hypothetical protein
MMMSYDWAARYTLMAPGWMPPVALVTQGLGRTQVVQAPTSIGNCVPELASREWRRVALGCSPGQQIDRPVPLAGVLPGLVAVGVGVVT